MMRYEATIEIAGEASNRRAAVDLTRQLQPDVVLMDLSVLVMNELAKRRSVTAGFPSVCIIGCRGATGMGGPRPCETREQSISSPRARPPIS